MPLKAKALILLLVFGVGFYAGTKFNSSKPEKPPEISQDQKQKQGQVADCFIVQKKTTNPDGSIDELLELHSKNKQDQGQEQKQAIKQAESSGLEFFIGGAIDTSLRPKAAFNAVFAGHSAEILTDFKNDHVFIYKTRVLEW